MGYDATAVAIMAARSAAVHAQFFLPHIKSGLSVLDCGCGPGTITTGLADLAAPGRVLGLEIEPTQVEMARRAIDGRTNLTFDIGDIYELPVESHSFDRVHIGAVLMNLREPVRGLKEAFRVLKPGGALGVREGDQGGDIIAPSDPIIDKGMALYTKLRKHNGHDPFLGRRLRGLLHDVGFERIEVTAAYESHGTPEGVREVARIWHGMITKSNVAKQLLELGWANEFALRIMASKCESFAERPDSFSATAWCQAVAWKPA
jgi:ubiquinone/menaquinone biosynthesis C-methylase UbiE